MIIKTRTPRVGSGAVPSGMSAATLAWATGPLAARSGAAWPNTNVGGGAPTVGARDLPSWAGASEASAVVMVLPTGRLDAPRW